MIHEDSQIHVVISKTKNYEPFSHFEVFEDKNVEFCVIVWGLVQEPLHVMVETDDSALAMGECNSIRITHYNN